MIEHKRPRRVEIGPFVTVFFEDKATLLYQIQEMLFAEGGGAEQLVDELAAYAPLLPGPLELVVTMMIEGSDIVERQKILHQLGGVEKTLILRIGEENIYAQEAHQDGVERTTPEGKTSAVHFLRFRLNEKQAHKFKEAQVDLLFDHPNYTYKIRLPAQTQFMLAEDLKV